MALTLMLPKMRSYLYSLDPEMFDFGPTRAVFEFLAEHPDFDGKDTKQAKKIAEYGKILSLVFETLYQDIDQTELTSEARRLQASLVSQYVRMQKQTIVEQLQTAEPKEADQLLMRARDLDSLLRTEQEGTERGTEER